MLRGALEMAEAEREDLLVVLKADDIPAPVEDQASGYSLYRLVQG